ncbi:hypothetical protein [Natronorubrum sp. FCH18a]|uniref:hypothetical protein n=1 Tax=Natronorubrum sp. FCH18a TaxID=3447018 RepID=UPI003F511F9A
MTAAESRVGDLRHERYRHPEAVWSTFVSIARIVDELGRIRVESLMGTSLATAGRRP